MKITNISVSEKGAQNEIRGLCGDFELWYRFPKHILPEMRADAFIAASLIPAMFCGEDIVLDDEIPVSPLLLKNIEQLQDIFIMWGHGFGKVLRRIKVTGGICIPPQSTNDATVSFFSGGVDGTHTFLKHREEIDYLLFSKGIDIQLSNEEMYQVAFEKNVGFLKRKDKNLFPVETNVRFFGHEFGLTWILCFGGGLSSIALAGGFKKCFIASSLSYADLYPHGSSFVSDHLWRNEHTEIKHDGAEATRIDKIRFIAKDEDALNILRVCWHDKGYNCGECEKCLRTMASLRILKLNAPTFPECTDQLVREKISKLKLYDNHDGAFMEENLAEARHVGDMVLVRALLKIKRNTGRRQMLHILDETYLGNRLSLLKKKVGNLLSK
ncbi:MAG: hypothetical protein COA96_03690 [SAR86 cluster bacterium]|uniref:Uncharacterized protein n=1 Tax=SAR86 cluster bacterium TaxID=2030880 RepID=A0A2A5B850_9GAMM|nr:MAG: hypothetical protein COA96_03690 [SAR86 cluster bacterium]